MVVESLPGFRCTCLGDVCFEVFDQDGGRLAVVVLHHGATLRWGQWESDAVLTDGRLLLAWLDRHGMSGPMQQFKADRQRAEQGAPPAPSQVEASPSRGTGMPGDGAGTVARSNALWLGP